MLCPGYVLENVVYFLLWLLGSERGKFRSMSLVVEEKRAELFAESRAILARWLGVKHQHLSKLYAVKSPHLVQQFAWDTSR